MFFNREDRNRFRSMQREIPDLYGIVRRLERSQPVPEFLTGIMLDPRNCDRVRLIHISPDQIDAEGNRVVTLRAEAGATIGGILKQAARMIGGGAYCAAPEQYAYFRKGTAPDCDYIKCDGDKLTYWKRPTAPTKPKDRQVFPKI